MARRPLAALLAAALLLTGTGCWNRREVNEIAIVTAVAVDRESDQSLRVTILVLDPASSGQGGEGSPAKAGTFRVTATGQTMMDALRNINQVISRRPEWKHNNAIIISEEVARQGVSRVLDFFVRNYESRLDQWLLVSHGKAADMLVPRFRLEENQGAGLRRLNLIAARTTAKTVPVRLREFMVSLAGPPAAALTSIIDRAPRAGDPEAAPESEARLRTHGAAIFSGDKLAGFLSDRDARGVQWLRGEVNGALVVVPCKKGPGEGIGVDVLSARATLRPDWSGGKYPAVRASVQVAGILGDLMCPEDMHKPEALFDLERRTAKVVTAEIAHAVDVLQQQLGADPVGIGGALGRAYPAAWKQWKGKWSEVWPQIRIIPEVNVQIEQTGSTNGKPPVGAPGASEGGGGG